MLFKCNLQCHTAVLSWLSTFPELHVLVGLNYFHNKAKTMAARPGIKNTSENNDNYIATPTKMIQFTMIMMWGVDVEIYDHKSEPKQCKLQWNRTKILMGKKRKVQMKCNTTSTYVLTEISLSPDSSFSRNEVTSLALDFNCFWIWAISSAAFSADVSALVALSQPDRNSWGNIQLVVSVGL